MSRRRQSSNPSARLRALKHDLSKSVRSSQKHGERTPLQLLIVASYLNRLNFIETINNSVRWDEDQWKFSPGVLAQLFVFAGYKMTPLYK